MDYSILEFDALIFSLGVRLHCGLLRSFNFFNVNPKFDKEIVKFFAQISWIQIFTIFLFLVGAILSRRSCN